MALRTMLGIGWSILCGLAGGWLALMPWALNVQGDGDWTAVTKGSFWTGVGLLALGLVGLVVTLGEVARLLAPSLRTREHRPAGEHRADEEELDRTLLQLATKLAADLDASTSSRAAVAAPTDGSSVDDHGATRSRVEQ